MTPSDKWMAFHKYDLQMKNPFGKFCCGVWFTDMCSNIHIYNKFSSYAENKLCRYVLWLVNITRRIGRIRQKHVFLNALRQKEFHHPIKNFSEN